MEALGKVTYVGPPGLAKGIRLVGAAKVGVRHLAIPAGGPVDPPSAQYANQLAGNPIDSPLFEVPLHGGKWILTGDITLALTGADIDWQLNGDAISRCSSIKIPGGGTLSGTWAVAGRYGYLAIRHLILPNARSSVHGGDGLVEVGKSWMSRGPFEILPDTANAIPSPANPPRRDDKIVVTGHPGPEWYSLHLTDRTHILNSLFRVLPNSDRQGVRLAVADGGKSSTSIIPPMLSSPVLSGTVQWTPAGPIVLGPDAQTIGGYPRIFQLKDQELASLYQLPIGGLVKFRAVW